MNELIMILKNQNWVWLPQRMFSPDKLVISSIDQEILRRLAGHVAQIAARPIEKEKRDLWFRHNALEATRPPIFLSPENGWNEIIPESQIQCRGELARDWEVTLRADIFWGESMGDDRVTEPFFFIPYMYVESDWGMHERRVGGQGRGAYTWHSPLKSYDDLDKIRFASVSVDYDATNRLLSLAERALGDLLTVRLKERWRMGGLTSKLARLRGLEQMMFDAHDYPDELHRLMGILRDGTLAKIDFLEKNELLSLNNDGTYVGSGGFGYIRDLPKNGSNGKKVRACDMWGFGESQPTVAFSPDMFAEFFFPYISAVLDRFGLNCYGCCEPLDNYWDIIKKAPRLRRVSVSPFADVAAMAEKLGDQYIYSWKPSPNVLAAPSLNEDLARAELRRALQITRGCRVEIIMKDIMTVGNDPQNVIRWCQIAREEAEAV